MDKAKELLTKTDGKNEGVYFLVPSLLLMYLQLSPLQDNQKTSERYTVNLPFKCMILLRTDRDNAHPHAHWVVVLKKYRLHHAYHLCRLIKDDLQMAEK